MSIDTNTINPYLKYIEKGGVAPKLVPDNVELAQMALLLELHRHPHFEDVDDLAYLTPAEQPLRARFGQLGRELDQLLAPDDDTFQADAARGTEQKLYPGEFLSGVDWEVYMNHRTRPYQHHARD